MNDNPAPRAAVEACARRVALGLANAAGWSAEMAGAMLSPPYAGYYYCPEPELLLVPTSLAADYVRPAADAASREARSDVLIVSADGREIRLALGLWRRCVTEWHMSTRLWIAPDRTLCLIVDGITTPCQMHRPYVTYVLRQGRLALLPIPWTSPGDAGGTARALNWLDALTRE